MDLNKILKNIPELDLDEAKKKTLFVYALGLIAVLVLYVFLFLKPSLARLSDLFPKLRQVRKDIQEVQNDLAFRDKLEKRIDALEAQIGKYAKRLSREKEIPLLLENLSQLAKKSRVKILGITPVKRRLFGKPGEKSRDAVYQEVPIAITAQCGYHELGVFINKLENDRRYLQISDLNIKANKANPKKHDVEFVVYAYTLKTEKNEKPKK